MSSTQTVQMQQHGEDMSTSIEHLQTKQPNKQMVNNIMETYEDMEIQENEDDHPEEIYDRQMMNDVNEPSNYENEQAHQNQNHNQHQANIQNVPVKQEKTVFNQLTDTLRGPLAVMVIFIVLNQPFVINFINSLFVGYFGEDSFYNAYSILFRAVLSAVLFYTVNYFT
jgi:hypothetical protein